MLVLKPYKGYGIGEIQDGMTFQGQQSKNSKIPPFFFHPHISLQFPVYLIGRQLFLTPAQSLMLNF